MMPSSLFKTPQVALLRAVALPDHSHYSPVYQGIAIKLKVMPMDFPGVLLV
jgi:hypothetical protein